MKIAVIGSGISGLTCAYLLRQVHEVTLFEKNERLGGHTATRKIKHEGRTYNIDTGFIVFNDWTYPNFIKLLHKLGVASQPTRMSFSVSCSKTGLEYSGTSINSLFAQRKNLFNFKYLGMLQDIVRFNKQAVLDLEKNLIPESLTLGEYLKQNNYGEKFASHYLVPMGSAIWSSTLQEMMDFPLLFFVRFFKNHGLLSIKNRPQWRVIQGGSRSYIQPMIKGMAENIIMGADIARVIRTQDCVFLEHSDGSREKFDQVVFACHSDEALALLESPTAEEQEILGAIPYRNNRVVLHTDDSILPKAKLAWSAWNYHLHSDEAAPPTLSYNMNLLQGISSDTTFVVSLNPREQIPEDKILGEYQYAHPVFTLEGIAAQNRWSDISGENNTWYCGAYWRNGFHEDGCVSGIRVAKGLGAPW
ncbi:Predicted NAD/FAD-binding protein [Alteromonadaceae bacterium Bs31]|nr:Predicted NAD/FAD-binding protein [Alteromonadaceae bacterium Bs31]